MRLSLSAYLRFLRRFIPQAVTEERLNIFQSELASEASWTTNYVVLIISSCAIATFGLLSNSAAVIIGAMLIAPLMLPLRGLAFSALEGDVPLFRKSVIAIVGGTLLAILFSWFLGAIVPIAGFGSEFQARIRPDIVDLGIALAAGGISGFAKVRKGVSDAVAGTAIAVALMPPLCVVGLALSAGLWDSAMGAFLLYATNLLGITLACMLVFIIAGYAQVSHSITWAILSAVFLVIPLGTNFLELVQKSRLESVVRTLLLRQTITIGQEDVTLIDTRIDWSTRVPIVYLNLQAAIDITPKQVLEVERFVSQQVGRELKFVLFVSQGKTVTADGVNLNMTIPLQVDRLFMRELRPSPETNPVPSPIPPDLDSIEKPPKENQENP
ncbi:DUF389 domain-containing protein [Spirulina subsalsa FACHB-351]|uniref:DUF389 domain-containing protein n=1 Tax=Spirulina subsalsa FACHB-351 TaxID=234711 RepID=A0ABT3L566_9CYAN|nr:DUF389 domain-containing protein [Spirulina subsalsa]MCW6036638.1 DUF389 domain-containing protein [Spirulina subsalsa FACHB-351]